ncbi:MAG: MMPL family transporter [Flavobacteriia bacterium]|nr:MMPL family transporter [Flavobacteriia bacterium]OJX36163.1 MAG: hypothetical protein BGO87_06770 [Flavobacteriia bacterium 40-80]
MWQKIGNIVLRNRLFIIAVILLLTVFFGYFALTNLKIDNKYGNTLPKDSEVQMQYLKFKEQFGEDGSTLVIAIDNKKLYTEKNFKKWKELGDSILKMDGVLSVISEATLFTINDNKADEKFEAKKIYSDPTFTEKSIDSIRREVKKNPIYDHLLYNDSTHISLMMIGLDENYLADQTKQDFVLALEKFADTYEKELGHMHFAGLPHIRIVIGKRIVNEMLLFIGLALAASCVLIYYFFRSFKVVMICVAVIVISVIWALGTIGLFDFKLSVMMALIPPLMIVVGVPNSVFFYTRFHQEYRISRNKIRATSSMIKKIGGATFLTNLTTAIGFCTFTSSEKLMEFGIISSLNIMVVFVLSLCLIPIAISYSADPKERHLAHLDRESSTKMLDIIVNLVTHHRTAIYVVSIILSVIFILGSLKIKATGNLTSDLPKSDQILKDLKYVEKSFGGTIPFEILVNYKTPGRLFKNETLEKIESVQNMIYNDSLFSKSLSYVDFLKVINMAMYDNDPEYYRIISNRDKLKLKKYIEKFDITNANGAAFSLKELIDTLNTTIRIRTQMKDLGSAEVRDKVEIIKGKIDSVLNPDKKELERLYGLVESGKQEYIDSILGNYSYVQNSLTHQISSGNDELQYQFDMNPEKIKEYYSKPYFNRKLRAALDSEYYDSAVTGTSVVAAEGTKYLFINMVESIVFAIITISALMSLLFNSWKMTVISMIPNIIPLIFIAGFMGFFHVDLKPSTLLVFGIALGITVDNAILFLAKYRQEMRTRKWDIKYTIIKSLRETGLGIVYTSIVLFFGFSMFYFSQFGGTKAMGMLVSLAILVGTFTNVLILPSLLLSLEKYVTSESFNEPYFEIYDEEEDIELDNLQVREEEESDDIDKLN